MHLALPSVSTVKPFCNKRITLTHTANNLIQAKQMKNKHSGLFTRLLVFKKYAILLKIIEIHDYYCKLKLLRMHLD